MAENRRDRSRVQMTVYRYTLLINCWSRGKHFHLFCDTLESRYFTCSLHLHGLEKSNVK